MRRRQVCFPACAECLRSSSLFVFCPLPTAFQREARITRDGISIMQWMWVLKPSASSLPI